MITSIMPVLINWHGNGSIPGIEIYKEMKSLTFNRFRSGVKLQIDRLSTEGFRQIFDHIDQLNIKKGVDKLGVDKFVEQCAFLSASTGAIAGSGGMLTLVIGTPVDMANLITQQFRVTMGIMYANQGSYQLGFEEFMSMIATSLKVEAGVALTKTMMESIAEKLLLMVGTRTAERLVPIVGGVIGGTANYLFIKRVADSVKKAQLQVKTIVIS